MEHLWMVVGIENGGREAGKIVYPLCLSTPSLVGSDQNSFLERVPKICTVPEFGW
jgi:hypothetical protein